MVFASSQIVYAEPAPDTLPTGYSPVSGSTSYSVNGNTGTLISSGPATVGNWDSFSIGSQSTFNAQIEGSHLSKVIGQSPSEIFGSLNVQSGQFFLVNPNGILFGSGSQVNAPGLVASTLNILENDFLAGRYNFSAPTGSNRYLLNQGRIETQPGGYIALIGRSVRNEGELSAPGAGVVMAAGDQVTLSLDGSGLVSAAVNAPVQADVYDFAGNKVSDTLSNTGSISADGGYAVLTARSTENIFDNVINHSGVITANAIENKNGVITLTGGSDAGVVRVSGGLQASGGEINILGNKVGVFKNATVDVSSQTGDGGKIMLFAEDVALAYGSFSADAAAVGGDGGFIETSGKNYLDTAGIRLSARAVEGDPGTWLLDPYNVTISSSATAFESFGTGTFTPTASGANILNTDINTQLNLGTSVTILTTGAGLETGNITVNAPIAKSASAAALTLTALGGIIINESITSTSVPLNVTMTAGSNIMIGNGAGDTINANNGTVLLTAGGAINGDTSSTTHISASSVSLTSGSGIGTSGALNLITPTLTNASVSGTGDITLELLGGGAKNIGTVNTHNGDIDITSADSLLVDVVSTGTGGGGIAGSIYLTTTAGSIKDNANDQTPDLIGDYVFVTSVDGIGASNTNLSLDVNANTLSAETGTSGIYIDLIVNAGATNGLAANHDTTAYVEATGAGDIVLTGTVGTGDRYILDAETFNGNITIGSGFGDLYADDIYSDTGVAGLNDIVINAAGAGADLTVGYLQSDDAITLIAPNGSIFDYDVDIQNFATSGVITLTASGDAGEIDNPLEHLSSNIPIVTGVSGTDYLSPCDSFFCGDLADDPFLEALLASYSSLYSESFDDASAELPDGLSDGEVFGDEAASGEEESEGEKDKDEDAESTDNSTQTQTEQQKDIENDAPATENVTVSEQTFNPC